MGTGWALEASAAVDAQPIEVSFLPRGLFPFNLCRKGVGVDGSEACGDRRRQDDDPR